MAFAALVLCVGLASVEGNVARAQSILDGGTIEEIRVEGSLRVDPQTIRTYMTVDPGDPFDPVALDQSLKEIFATGLFADVTLRRERNTLIVRVVENPIINRIAFEGNDAIDDEELRVEVELQPRQVFTITRAQNDVQRILDLYRRNGRFGAQVEPKIIELDQNRVDLVFEIVEGEVTGVIAINFVGNRAFSDSELRGEISTQESAWYRFLSSSDTYDPDRIAFDRELLRRYYLSEGYADFEVESAVAELADDGSGFIITFTLREGEQYSFGEVNVETTLRDLNPEDVEDSVTTFEGETYDASEVEKTVQNLTEAVGNLGYAFVDVNVRVERDRENLTISITYAIQEGPRVFVERIDIIDNTRTLDRVIRREFRLVEGDAFNSEKLRRSRQRIENLGFFRSVEVTNEQGSTQDRTVITVSVEEQSTGDLTFGAGFSSASGPLGSIQLRERNLLGTGQDLRLATVIAGSSTQIDLSFTEPYFLEMPLSTGFDVFRTTREDEEADFDEERIGFSLRAGYELTERLRHVVRYTLEHRDISNVDNNAPTQIKLEEGSTLRSSITNSMTYDARDSRFDPRDGYLVSLSNTYLGIGGDVYAFESTVNGSYYIPLWDESSFAIKGSAGHLVGIGQDTRISDRFFIGGNSFRGFERGLGPRSGGDALGANSFAVGTFEFSFPLGLPEEYDIRGRLFTDFGSAWGVDGSTSGVQDDTSLRVAVGPGISWNSPFGPLVIDLGFAVLSESYDETQVLNFSFGTQF